MMSLLSHNSTSLACRLSASGPSPFPYRCSKPTFCGPRLIWLLLAHTDVSSKTNIFQSSRDNYVKFSSFSSMMVTASQGKSEKWLKDSQFNILGCLFWSRIYGHDISGSKIHSLQVKRGKPLTNRWKYYEYVHSWLLSLRHDLFMLCCFQDYPNCISLTNKYCKILF